MSRLNCRWEERAGSARRESVRRKAGGLAPGAHSGCLPVLHLLTWALRSEIAATTWESQLSMSLIGGWSGG